MTPTNNIGYLLQHLPAVLAKQSDHALQSRLGIGYSQLKILLVLQNSPQTLQRQIAHSLGQTEASVSRQIRLMVDKGLLHSTISPKNRREHLTTATLRGEQLAEEATAVLNDFHASMFDNLGEQRQQQLLEILTQMHRYACQPRKAGACQHLINS